MARGRRPLSNQEQFQRKGFGTLLKARRRSLNKGLRETARAVGVDHTRLYRIESGERPASPRILYAIAEAYEVPWGALVLAKNGQLPFAQLAPLWQSRDERVGLRNEMLAVPLTASEKEELTRYLRYLRFVEDTEDVLSTAEG